MEWYDTRRLFEDADARVVVRRLWAKDDFRQTGATLFVKCPSGHKETRLDHCAVYKEGCKCFSCGNHYGLKEMMEIYFPGKKFPEICSLIADAIGNKEDYLTKKTGHKKEDPFPLNMQELDIIGLYSPEREPDVPKITALYKDEPRACRMLLRHRAKEFTEKYKKFRDEEKNPDLQAEFAKRTELAEQILKKLGG